MIAIALVVAFIQAVGIMALIAIGFGAIVRTKLIPLHKSLLIGIIFSLAAIFLMLTPVILAPGITLDGHAIILGLSAVFGGLPAAILATGLTSSVYFYIGSDVALSGIVGNILAASLGALWIKLCVSKTPLNSINLMLGGAFVSLQFFTIYLLPLEIANNLIARVYPLLLPAFMLSAVIIGKLIERECELTDSIRNLENEANTDALTGLMNRRGLEASIASASQQSKRIDSVVIFDLDNFKNVNDEHGHAGGDKALIAFAAILKLSARDIDVVARIGGEEFALFLRDTTAQQAEIITQRILQSVRATPIHCDGQSFLVTVSAGISQFLARDNEYFQAIRKADQALYKAKRNGRDQLVQASMLQQS